MKISNKAPKFIAWLTLAIGIIDLVLNASRHFHHSNSNIGNYLLVYVNSSAYATSVFTGIVLILLSRGLRRRKKRAWNLTVGIVCLNLIAEFLRYRLHFTHIALSVILLGILIYYRNEFKAISDPTTKFRPLYLFIFATVTFSSLGVLILLFRHSDEVVGKHPIWELLKTVFLGFIWVDGPIKMDNRIAQDTLQVTLGTFGLFIILIPLWAYFRRISAIPTSTISEQTEIAELVDKHGDGDSLAFFATREDKSVVWTKNRKGGIAYRVQSGVMLASGDPFGPLTLWQEAIEEFLQTCLTHGWTPAVMGASERGGRKWMDVANLAAIEIGDEAIIQVEDYSLEGHTMSNVRQTINKAKREGFTCKSQLIKDLTQEDRELIKAKAQEWRGNSVERGFSMAMDRFMGEIDNPALIILGYLEGKLVGFLYFVPWGKVGYSLDRMQRAPEIPVGLTEMMIDAAVTFCAEHKMKSISLNFAAFRSVIERAEKINAGPLLRTLRTLIRITSGWFQIDTLYRFNSKFNPDWQARYLLYPSVGELGNVIWAALRAEKFIQIFGENRK